MNAIFKPQFPVSSHFNFSELNANTFDGQHWYEVSDLTEYTAVIGVGSNQNYAVGYTLNNGEAVITTVQQIVEVRGIDYLSDITASMQQENNAPLLDYLTESLTDALAKEQKRLAKQSEPDELDDMFAFLDKHSFKHN